jgi:hypothetical protein
VRNLKWLMPSIACALSITVAFIACAKPNSDASANRSAVTEAYTLMDRGENGRAVELLENVVAQEPHNSEARLILASAYMGKAGIDVLALHDAFHDVLFSKSLSQVFATHGDSAAAGATKPTPTPKPKDEHPSEDTLHDRRQPLDDTPAEKMIRNLDDSLDSLRRVMVIFDRFPHVSENKWPYLDQALFQLSQIEPAKEVRVYRLFIRMIYFKEYLVRKIIRDTTFGTRAWACRLELEEFNEGLNWIMALLAGASEDFKALYPREESPFDQGREIFRKMSEAIVTTQEGAPQNGDKSVAASQLKLRETLRCGH